MLYLHVVNCTRNGFKLAQMQASLFIFTVKCLCKYNAQCAQDVEVGVFLLENVRQSAMYVDKSIIRPWLK